MLHTELLLGRFQFVEVVGRLPAGELIQAADESGTAVLLLVPDTTERARTESKRLEVVACCGVPACSRVVEGGEGTLALVLEG